MNASLFSARKLNKALQVAISLGLIILAAALCHLAGPYLGYRTVALILLALVSLIAMFLDMLAVLVAAFVSALVWNFFFIPPTLTFHIENTDDALMFLLYFLIALINTSLTVAIRKAERKAREMEENKRSLKLYNTLLNSLSHELRTPITTITGAVDALLDENTKLTKENTQQLFTEIDKASLRLNEQVENLLNMSRLESGVLQVRPDWHDLGEVIRGVIQKISVSSSHKIEFEEQENLPLFFIDAGLVEQILHNLVQNGLTHTPDGTTIRVGICQAETGCKIMVSDNGIGFPPNEMERAFDKFYRLNKAITGGSGLGLSIVKGFTEAMNGHVSLRNNENGGATFIVEIPANQSFLSSIKNE